MRWLAITLLAGCLCPGGGELLADGTCGTAASTEEGFNETFSNTFCEMSNNCLVNEGLEPVECFFDPQAMDGIRCDFDRENARACVDQLEFSECDGAVLTIPATCGQVFTNCTGF